HYGVEGRDFQYDARGNPIVTKQGHAENVFWSSITSNAPVLFDPNSRLGQKYASITQSEVREMFSVGVEDPAIGLFSLSYATKGAVMNRSFGDGIDDIVAGRRPLSDYATLVKAWLDGGGAQAKVEFQRAYEAARK
ncbi:MAG: hypothetical protein ACRDHX_16925, partial [Chloroflexota bacterium]